MTFDQPSAKKQNNNSYKVKRYVPTLKMLAIALDRSEGQNTVCMSNSLIDKIYVIKDDITDRGKNKYRSDD